MPNDNGDEHDHNSEECNCAHVLHMFPENEDEAKHQITQKCVCDPTVSNGYEEEGADDEDLREITIVRHNRRH